MTPQRLAEIDAALVVNRDSIADLARDLRDALAAAHAGLFALSRCDGWGILGREQFAAIAERIAANALAASGASEGK
jgi:hypothetical protein